MKHRPTSGITDRDDLAEARAAADYWKNRALVSEAEAATWKRRCYPTPSDLVERSITAAQLEAYLDAKTQRLPDHEDRWRIRWPMWRDATGVEYVAEWRTTDDEPKALREMAETIEMLSDSLGLDQWAVLDEIAAMNTESAGMCRG